MSLESKVAKGTIHYTLDGSEPGENSPVYKSPLSLNTTTEVKAILSMDGWPDSPVSSRTFARARYPVDRIKLSAKPNEKYSGNGAKTLYDGKKGSSTFSDGEWLGYFAKNLIVTADLGRVEAVEGVTIGVLSDFNSYIHPPTSIEVASSVDGKKYGAYQRKEISIPERLTEAAVQNHYLALNTEKEVRFLRIRLTNRRVNPPWHPAPGAECWMFLDEILVD